MSLGSGTLAPIPDRVYDAALVVNPVILVIDMLLMLMLITLYAIDNDATQ